MPAPVRMTLVDGSDRVATRRALQAALAGGAPVAPLPPAGAERDRALALLRPDQPVVEPDAAAVVLTSGSTGRPKAVVLTRRSLRASSRATHDRLGGTGDWIAALPSHYVAGLMVLVRAIVAGTASWSCRADLADLEQAVGRRPDRRYLSLVPAQLDRALESPATTALLAGMDAVLLGGSATSAALLERARTAGLRVVTTYGMSETCGGCCYDGVPLDGVDISLATDNRVLISGDVVFAGYRLDPEQTAAALAGTGDRTLKTQDRGRWIDGRLQLLGRVDDIVTTGGLKVDLAEVEQIAAAWDSGADTVVIAVPDLRWGATVLAVTTSHRPLAALQELLSAALPRHAVPRRWARLDVLPRTSGGKVDRAGLRAHFAAEGTTASAPALAERPQVADGDR